jgi:hypothetical protein
MIKEKDKKKKKGSLGLAKWNGDFSDGNWIQQSYFGSHCQEKNFRGKFFETGVGEAICEALLLLSSQMFKTCLALC